MSKYICNYMISKYDNKYKQSTNRHAKQNNRSH